MKKFYIEFSGICTVVAKDEKEAKEKFYNREFYLDYDQIEKIEEKGE